MRIFLKTKYENWGIRHRLLGSLLKMCFSFLKILKPSEAIVNNTGFLWNSGWCFPTLVHVESETQSQRKLPDWKPNCEKVQRALKTTETPPCKTHWNDCFVFCEINPLWNLLKAKPKWENKILFGIKGEIWVMISLQYKVKGKEPLFPKPICYVQFTSCSLFCRYA